MISLVPVATPFLGELSLCWPYLTKFSFAIDNPSIESEKKMLKSYAPDLEDHILDRLVATFGELRSLADRGQTQYPYSTREAVAIVKHFQKYPEDGLQVRPCLTVSY